MRCASRYYHAALYARRCQCPTSGPARLISLRVGDVAELKKSFSQEDVAAFARLSGDTNPVHLDERYAADTRFKRRIVHGFLSGSLIGAALGTAFPGAIYLSQTLQFKAPVFADELLHARVTITDVNHAKKLVTCRTEVVKASTPLMPRDSASLATLVITGEALVLIPDLQ